MLVIAFKFNTFMQSIAKVYELHRYFLHDNITKLLKTVLCKKNKKAVIVTDCHHVCKKISIHNNQLGLGGIFFVKYIVQTVKNATEIKRE